jgi:hypothetical protein
MQEKNVKIWHKKRGATAPLVFTLVSLVHLKVGIIFVQVLVQPILVSKPLYPQFVRPRILKSVLFDYSDITTFENFTLVS